MKAAGWRPAVWAGALWWVCTSVGAQSLPPPSRTVFKCEVNGRTVYSDEPCLGAQTVDVEPTRGLNRYSGRERVGADVHHERNREAMAEALKPLTGMNARQLSVHQRRMSLPQEAQRECHRLDTTLLRLQEQEQQTRAPERAGVQAQLMTLRTRHRELGC